MNGEPDDDRSYWYRGMSAFLELQDSAEAFVAERITGYSESPYQKTFAGIRRLIGSMNQESSWSAYFEQFRPYVETSLPFIVHAMEVGVHPVTVPRGSVDEVVARIEAVREEVKTSELPSLLKHQLDVALGELLVKIAKYELYGVDGIATAAATVVSAIIVQSDAAKSSPATVKSVFDMIAQLENIILRTPEIWAIAGPVIAGLLTGSHK